MKHLLTFFTVVFTLFSIAQQPDHWCGFDHKLQEKIDANPNYLQELGQQIETIRSSQTATPKSTFIIPVVFHIIHDGGAGNITMEQIQSGLDVMNEDFNGLNSDAANIRNTVDAPFVPVYANVDVEFRLAKIDPSGNCTNGVQRKYAPDLTNNAGEDCKYASNGGLSAWPNDKYLNIWVVNSIETNQPGMILGYAYLPYDNWGSGHGILNRHDRIGRIGTALQNGGRTLTHEMGHICGLLHTFQDDCHSSNCANNGDYICDTPPVEQIFGCNQSYNSCTDVPINDFYGYDVYDQNENHMAYSSCRIMFTEGQKNLMQANFNNIPNFVSLTSPANLTATGVNQPDVLCEADFYSSNQIICVGETIDFFDNSYNGQTGWNWSFAGGNPAVSTDQYPVVTYNNPGVYQVELEVTDGTSSITETRLEYITVLPSSGAQLPYYESFESFTEIPNNEWFVLNPGENNAFELGNVGRTGQKSARLSNFGQPIGNTDQLISSTIDLSGITDEVTLSFRYAYRKRNTANEEWLRVYVTNNCGETWAQRRTIKGDNLSPIVETTSWEPTSINDWTTVHMTNITSSFWVEDLRFMFEFENDGGNNFFIDDINIYAGAPSEEIVSLNQIEHNLNGLKVYPNPADNQLTIDFTMETGESVELNLTNALGQSIQRNLIHAQSGKNKVILDIETVTAGMYIVEIKNNNVVERVQVIVRK